MKLKLAYFGSPDFSALFLEKILNDPDLKNILEVKFVVTQPDRPVGRKQILTQTPVKQVAEKYQISNIKYQKDIRNLKLEIKNLDLAFVYASSLIIPKELLDLPKYGFWCLHPSLLPKYRGPSPITYALINGEKKTGVTIFKMDEKIDHGPIIAQKSLTIKITDYRPDLEKKLTMLGFEMFKKLVLTDFNRFQLTAQEDKNATYTRILTKQDGFIAFSTLKKVLNNEELTYEELPKLLKENLKQKDCHHQLGSGSQKNNFKNLKLKIKNSSEQIFNLFRGLYPWPGLWTILPNGKRLKIIDMYFNVASSTLQITRVQLEGKKAVNFETFQRAYHFF